MGADTLAENYARAKEIPFTVYLPEWGKYGRKAPFVRNKLIVNDSEVILAFWDGRSTGTKHSLDYAKQKGIRTLVFLFSC
jgi:peptidoglycan/xylan/chitin deacetylase (PgdA/CDA1 family)